MGILASPVGSPAGTPGEIRWESKAVSFQLRSCPVELVPPPVRDTCCNGLGVLCRRFGSTWLSKQEPGDAIKVQNAWRSP